MTNAGQLPCRRLLHCVGPRYNEQYKTAEENALHFCYRNALRMVKEENMRSVALTCVYTKRKRYPRDQAAHIVARTVRRFLEKWSDDIDNVVFCFDNEEDAAIYARVIPLYFPRDSGEEAHALQNLPLDTGNVDGEHVIVERKIKINAFPVAPAMSKKLFEENMKPRVPFEPLIAVPKNAVQAVGFGQLVPDQDQMRKEMVAKQLKQMDKNQKTSLKYERLLRDSRAEDLSDIAKLGFIYKSGRDFRGRTIVVIVARHLPAQQIDMNRVLLYIIRVMDSIVEREYSIVYVHSTMSSKNQPELSWMQEVASIFNRKYKKNLKQFFVVHPTFWVKMCFWTLSPIISDKFIGNKLKYINSIGELDKFLQTDQLSLPEAVKDFEVRKKGRSGGGNENGNGEGSGGTITGVQTVAAAVPASEVANRISAINL